MKNKALNLPYKLLIILSIFAILPACSSSDDDDDASNSAPSVSAGEDQTVNQGATVDLVGVASDSDGSISSWLWKQTSGSHSVTIKNSTTSNAYFSAPTVDTETTLVFELEVKDNDGASVSDSMRVTVLGPGDSVNPLPDNFEAEAGDGQVTLTWTHHSGATYNIYRSSDPNCELANYTTCTYGALFTSKSSGFTDDTGLTNGTNYYYWIEAILNGVTYLDGEGINATPTEITIISSPLNDTGINWGGDYDAGNNSDCSSNVSAPQDCDQGRDATDNDDSDGHAGFSFTKIDSSGNALAAASATEWSCVLDNVTGLIWEVKTDDDGLHDKDDSYNWYNTDPATNGGAVGYADYYGDICYGYDSSDASTYCNTEAFVSRVNAVALCGTSSWRLPSREELRSIVDYSRYDPSIDEDYFPNTQSVRYWSASPFIDGTDDAWNIYFYHGNDHYQNRHNNYYVRLVHSNQ